MSRIFYIIPIIAIIELYLLITIGGKIGFFPTVAIILITGFVGVTMLRRQGFSLLTQVQNKMQQGSLPAMELLEGVALLMGGVMLLTPGFMTDVLGLVLIFPATRKGLLHAMRAKLTRIVASSVSQSQGARSGYSSFEYRSYHADGSGRHSDASGATADPYTTAADAGREQQNDAEVIEGEFVREGESKASSSKNGDDSRPTSGPDTRGH